MGAVLYKRFGIKVCETTLQRVMSRSGLSARIRQVRKAKPCAGKANKQPLPGNLLNREFNADRPMHRMVTDVTYVPYFEDGEWHWGYLSLVQDLFDRSIVAWVYSKKQDIRLGLATLQLLSFRGLAPGAMLHSDRGTALPRGGRPHGLEAKLLADSQLSRQCHDGVLQWHVQGGESLQPAADARQSRL